jgi:hypothetical protein
MNESRYFQIRDAYPLLKNPSKYVGTRPISVRSGWEFKLIIKYLDVSPTILSWKSENTIVKYLSPIDNRYHRYFIDFTVTTKDKEGNTKELWIEVKPFKETVPPKTPKKKNKNYLYEVKTYYVNNAKWETTRQIIKEKQAQGQNIDFVIITEKDAPFFLS